MVDDHGGSDLLGTTDCLEAVGVFKGWKNFFFLIVLLCLLLLQASFYLVDRGYIKVDDQAYGGEPVEPNMVAEPNQPVEPNEPAGLDEPVELNKPAEGVKAVEPNEPAEPDTQPVEPNKPAEGDKPVEPNEPAEPNKPVEVVEPNEPAEPNVPTERDEPAEPNKPGDPNEVVRSGPAIRRIEEEVRAAKPQMQYAGQWFPQEFFSKITLAQLTWLIRLVNAVLILAATLYCLTLLFSLKVSLNGRLGGINHISRAFFLSLLMLVILLPWQRVFGGVVTGAIFTSEELAKWYSDKTDDMLDIALYYLRFSGYGALVLLLLILSQLRCMRWAKAILRRLEII